MQSASNCKFEYKWKHDFEVIYHPSNTFKCITSPFSTVLPPILWQSTSSGGSSFPQKLHFIHISNCKKNETSFSVQLTILHSELAFNLSALHKYTDFLNNQANSTEAKIHASSHSAKFPSPGAQMSNALVIFQNIYMKIKTQLPLFLPWSSPGLIGVFHCLLWPQHKIQNCKNKFLSNTSTPWHSRCATFGIQLWGVQAHCPAAKF